MPKDSRIAARYSGRMNQIRKRLRDSSLDAILLTECNHLRYLAGFRGVMGLLVLTLEKAYFAIGTRNSAEHVDEIHGSIIVASEAVSLDDLTLIEDFPSRGARFGFCAEYVSVKQLQQWRESGEDCEFVPADNLVADLGWCKDAEEIALIEAAVGIAERAFEQTLAKVTQGTSELRLCADLEYRMSLLGSECPAFKTLVASGPRSALPYAPPTKRTISSGEIVVVDFGATVDDYICDVCRTLVIGKASKLQERVYASVWNARTTAIDAVAAGVSGADVDSVCRRAMDSEGFGQYFPHATGHGVGLRVHRKHSGPRISRDSQDTLAVGNVVAIEPGVYIPGWGGVRIEDTMVVDKHGAKVLSLSPQRIIEV